MKEIKNYEEFKSLVKNKEKFILYGHISSCGVCDVFAPQIEKLADKYNIPLYGAMIEGLPEVRGQLSIFTVPVIVVFYEGREYHRQGRFLDLNEVEKRIVEISNV